MKTSTNKISTYDFEYNFWIKKNEKDILKTRVLNYNPKITIVVPVYNTLDNILDECILSVIHQTYSNWELCLIDDHSSWTSVRPCLSKYEKNDKIKIIYRKTNGNISVATNDGINAATGEFIGFLDCDDTLAPNALYEVAKKLNENNEYDFIYSDEDKLSENGKNRHQPFFKPDWSPDTFWSYNYCNHFSVYRKDLVLKTGGLRTEFNGAQDYDFVFRFLELTTNKKIAHISKILYHWRESQTSTASGNEIKPYVKEVARKLKEEALKRRGLIGEVEWIDDAKEYRVNFKAKDNPLVSIIILSKDHKNILNQAITSINTHTNYNNYEIIVVDNGSSNKEEIEKMLVNKATYIYKPMDFNFSAQCNIGAKAAKGDYILLLNDDIEIIQDDWLDRLVGQASLEHVGAVGAKLYYPNTNKIQHAGVINIAPGPSHAFLQMEDDEIFYFSRNRATYNYLAVTGACLICKRDIYFEMNGLDEALPVAYNDVDFCFKLYEHGYYNVLRNDVIAYHHESLSRGYDNMDKKKMDRLIKEREYLYSKHLLKMGEDPFYSEHLTSNNIDFSINATFDDTINNNYKLINTIAGNACIYGMSIDGLEQGKFIKISGWSSTDNYDQDENSIKTLLLKKKEDYILEIDTIPVPRSDVQNGIKSKALNTGFVAFIDSSVFKGEARNYTFGIKYNYNGKISYSWSSIQLELESSDSQLYITDSKNIGISSNDITVHIEQFSNNNGNVYIKGWAADFSEQIHNDCYIKYLATNKDGVFKKIPLHTKYRSDIVKIHSGYLNMLYTGFETIVPYSEISSCLSNKWYIIFEDMRNHKIKHKEITNLPIT